MFWRVPETRPEVVDQFAAHLLWMAEEPMLPGRSYLMRIGTRFVPARVTTLKHKVDVNTLEHIAAKTLGLNEIGMCNLATSAPVALDPYLGKSRNRRVHPDRPLHECHGGRRA